MIKQKTKGKFRWDYATLLVMFVVFAVISFGFQKGAKPLAGAHPYDYILMILSLILVVGLVWYYWGKSKRESQK